ncbi:hypothetical protein ACFZCP_05970 [Streptomyces sp. NPDC007971]|uniref:hypothetical protein n=1 Tax=Streptomyces sp. NPDC007971 TaxID=3364799 RepID=UPI0036E519AC
MSSRTRARLRKTAAGVHTVRIPRQRGRRSHQPFVVVVPERPSLLAELGSALALAVWDRRRPLAPLLLSVLALPLTGLLHWWAWWSGLLLAPLVAAPAGWLVFALKRRPAGRSVLLWRVGLTVAATSVLLWLALAAALGPLSGPLLVLWLVNTLAAQASWLFIHRKG